MAADTASQAQTDEVRTPKVEPSAQISTVTYCSRAVLAMSELDLHRLARSAQRRNDMEGVTGVMLYDHGWIYQHLEGPPEGLQRIWASISADRRHAAIDVLNSGPVDQRHFENWDLRLKVRGAQAGLRKGAIADEPPELIARLCRGESPADLLGLAGQSTDKPHASLVVVGDRLVLDRAILSELISTVIIPQLVAAAPIEAARPPPLSAALALLLIAVDASSAFLFVESTLDRYLSLGSLAIDLLEPTARALGDLWQSDDCSELDVTVGLMRLQAIAREFGLKTPRLRAWRPPAVLVVPPPGEAHMLGAALDAEMLWQAGWSPRVDFPSSNSSLDGLVANSWIDALDLSLSSSFRRDHRLQQMSETIRSARLASLNPKLVVVVSGRVFSDASMASEAAATSRQIGADGFFGSASQAQSSILQALQHPLHGSGSQADDAE